MLASIHQAASSGRAPRAARAALFALLITLPAVPGCLAIGAIAGKTVGTKYKPAYVGFKGQTVGVMVWADRSLQNEHAALQLDIAGGVQGQLAGAAKNGAEELVGTQFPADRGPVAMLAFQRNNPLFDSGSVTDVAPRLGVSRLIYIEVEDFALHPERVPELYRGSLTARIKVVEVTGGKGKVAYQDTVTTIFPPNSPEDGTINLDEQKTYLGTLSLFATDVARKFVSYEE